MTTAIEDNELNAELQELYLKSKHWISDLEFLKSELEFIKKLFRRTFYSLIKNDHFEKIKEIRVRTAKIDAIQVELKKSILQFLHTLEPLITHPDQSFNIHLVQTHTQLESRLNEVAIAFQAVKTMVFDLSKEGLKENTFTSFIK